ncbi:glycosyltransferase [Roseitranquillus sediminis]|uniref:glycosyltransferase n=1 Tax=Roseitranquillus sediminis TaxID=2809051 RepID=UPI001D0C1945|nr:glycosyltransferase family 2 protein [Roseitranquillus sediminis]MBM9596242.1 glycosyltransferase family 2 protein [Roseitranquillus sediminis]
MFDITVAIPAQDEAETIEAALTAIVAGAGETQGSIGIVVLANCCTDGTADFVGRFARRAPTHVGLIECDLPAERSDAGRARLLAMEAAAALTRAGGLILSTDADATLNEGTLGEVECAMAQGADLVCGTIDTELPPDISFAPSIRRIDGITSDYRRSAFEVRHAIDRIFGLQPPGPCPHYVEAGACVAVRTDFLRRIGGIPDVPHGEDRALLRRAEMFNGRVVYADRAGALVSPRLVGRAVGGMADAIRSRLRDPDPLADEALLSCEDIQRDWADAIAALGNDRRPVVREAEPQLRASDLERDLPSLRRFVEEVVRPDLAVIERGSVSCSA